MDSVMKGLMGRIFGLESPLVVTERMFGRF